MNRRTFIGRALGAIAAIFGAKQLHARVGSAKNLENYAFLLDMNHVRYLYHPPRRPPLIPYEPGKTPMARLPHLSYDPEQTPLAHLQKAVRERRQTATEVHNEVSAGLQRFKQKMAEHRDDIERAMLVTRHHGGDLEYIHEYWHDGEFVFDHGKPPFVVVKDVFLDDRKFKPGDIL